ncbi:glycosyltransferase family 4 protein [Colwellia ponticola]|uniref:Glycosyltransferase family 4 protein n=1 Tax=Colwellia ponticola TaxID=2304625 RepID=A0A8H2JLH1_9GAMM|nr:glycosyltransferase family 4 protein [Colwellia ponticola]TMM45269.1 glycosyltransferase family 4 protein [Colwellia ponticola]
MKKSILLIAFDFPPCNSPGVERTLRFAEHLQSLGWEPVVLTVNQSTFNTTIDNTFDDQFSFPVYRTFCLDVSKHFSYRGKYFGWMKQPDRYWGWLFTAIKEGLRLRKKHSINIIWSTYPLLTSHLIALVLSRLTKLPWLADYRDPLQCYYDPSVYPSFKFHRWIDKQTIKLCRKAIFTSAGASKLYKTLYPEICSSKFTVIENGFETSLYNELNQVSNIVISKKKHTMAHLGSLYENGRDPQTFFESLALLKKRNVLDSTNFELILVGANNQHIYSQYTESLGIDDIVSFYSQISHQESLKLSLSVDSLLIIQGAIFSAQIPSKVYEYLSSNKAILAITNKLSDTSTLLTEYEGCYVAESKGEIYNACLDVTSTKSSFIRDHDRFSRWSRAKELAHLLAETLKD